MLHVDVVFGFAEVSELGVEGFVAAFHEVDFWEAEEGVEFTVDFSVGVPHKLGHLRASMLRELAVEDNLCVLRH